MKMTSVTDCLFDSEEVCRYVAKNYLDGKALTLLQTTGLKWQFCLWHCPMNEKYSRADAAAGYERVAKRSISGSCVVLPECRCIGGRAVVKLTGALYNWEET